MAKIETPAEGSFPARRARSGVTLPPGAGLAPEARARSVDPLEVAQRRFEARVLHEFEGGPGVAKARRAMLRDLLPPDLADTTRSSVFPDEFEPALLGDDDVLDEPREPFALEPSHAARQAGGARFAAAGHHAASFGAPRAGGPKVPVANLEPPSLGRNDLTPSPVPRVSLAPATGAVDISLVPGPNGSRNLPTLAAQHALGRRQPRRPAPAVTLPPPGDESRESLPGAEVITRVRSSKREIVLGLTIGLGLSVVLAAVGQAFLREDVIAEAPAPASSLESVMLSARPEGTLPEQRSATSVLAPEPAGALPFIRSPEPARVAPPLGSGEERGGVQEWTQAEQVPSNDPGVQRAARDRAQSEVAGMDLSRRVPPRADAARRKARRALAIATELPAFTSEPGAEPSAGPGAASSAGRRAEPGSALTSERNSGRDEPEKAFADRSREPTSMSPAESAGLGLDLPL